MREKQKAKERTKIKTSWKIGMILLLVLNIGATGYFLYSLTLLGSIETFLRYIVGIVLIGLMIFFFFHLRKTARKKKRGRFIIDVILSIIYSAILIFVGGNIIKTIGKVIEVFVPKQYKNGSLLDIMDRTKIGFKVMTDNGIKEIIQEQNEFNAKIMKNDLVAIIKQTISDKDFVDIELYEGDEND